MRLTIILGLNHAEAESKAHEAARILTELAEQIRTKPSGIEVGDMHILRDVNGNRVGVADVFND